MVADVLTMRVRQKHGRGLHRHHVEHHSPADRKRTRYGSGPLGHSKFGVATLLDVLSHVSLARRPDRAGTRAHVADAHVDRPRRATERIQRDRRAGPEGPSAMGAEEAGRREPRTARCGEKETVP